MTTLDRLIASKTNYWFSFIADTITALTFITIGIITYTHNWAVVAIAIVTGALVWGLVEYLCHRWLFHQPGSPAYEGHMRHHHEPDELLAMPWFVTTIVMILLWLGLRLILPPAPVALFVATLLIGYIAYGSVHHLYHHVKINDLPGKLLKSSWANHKIHHKMLTTNYGVTTTFWDRVFGTHYRSRRQRDN